MLEAHRHLQAQHLPLREDRVEDGEEGGDVEVVGGEERGRELTVTRVTYD
jgi:hypothetical protein